jgi:hypothetical protein
MGTNVFIFAAVVKMEIVRYPEMLVLHIGLHDVVTQMLCSSSDMDQNFLCKLPNTKFNPDPFSSFEYETWNGGHGCQPFSEFVSQLCYSSCPHNLGLCAGAGGKVARA